MAYQQYLCQVTDEIVNTDDIKIKYSAFSAERKPGVSAILRTRFRKGDFPVVLTNVTQQAGFALHAASILYLS